MLHVAAEAREVFDVSGAGDTALAALATSLAAGEPLETAVRIANAAAAIAVGKLGNRRGDAGGSGGGPRPRPAAGSGAR